MAYDTCHEIEEFDSGKVYIVGHGHVFVPRDVDNPDHAARQAKSLPEGVDENGVVKFGKIRGRQSSTADRAQLWALVNDRVEKYETLDYQGDSEAILASDELVPVRVAREGNVLIAAYLAAHGYKNDQIASALDVGERTISQYITDFRKGER